MKLKSYFSSTVEAAMELARRELGDEALLVNARPATPETRYLGAYEVVFGVTQGAPEVAKQVLPMGQFARDLAGLRLEMEAIKKSLRGPQETISTENIATDATLGIPGAACAVVALVGPPGAGKTTTLVKLAARYGLACRKRTHFLCADLHRVGGAEQLLTFASILGIGCEVMEKPQDLMKAIDEHRSEELLLIDTPGVSSPEFEDAAPLARVLGGHPEVDIHLVLPASLRAEALARIAREYSAFRPKKLVLTRIDELGSSRLAIEEIRSLLVSFLCRGQQIPDDIEPATSRRLMELAGELSTTAEPHALGATA